MLYFSSVPLYRTVYGVNADGLLLRQAYLDSATDTKYWCYSRKYSEGLLVEERLPSAHSPQGAHGVFSDATLAAFLNPLAVVPNPEDQGKTTVSNDVLTLNATGLIRTYAYGADGHQTRAGIKQGYDGCDQPVSAAQYLEDAGREHLLSYTEVFGTPTTSLQTEYSYWYHSNGMTSTLSTVHPQVTHNAADTGGTAWQYFDQKGRLRWTKSEGGVVSYRAYSEATGKLGYYVQDVNTTTLPTELVDGDANGMWGSWGGTSAPFSTGSSSPQVLVTKVEYDDKGRTVKREGPDGSITYIVYGPRETRTYPAWNSTTNEPQMPVQVDVGDAAGHTVESYSFDPQYSDVSIGLTAGNRPSGVDSLNGGSLQAAYVSWKRNNYNVKGQLISTDVYHTIPPSSAGIEGENYYRTSYTFNLRGLLETQTAPDGTITKYVYDSAGRTATVSRGTTEQNLRQTATYEYDDNGVGNGKLTKEVAYFADSASATYTSTYDRNYLDQVTDWRRGDGRATKFSWDWLSRIYCKQEYDDSDNYNFSIDGRLLSETQTEYDERGRVYQQWQWEVAGGTKSDKLVTNVWYDAEGRVIKSCQPNGRCQKTVYDGLGRVKTSYVTYEDGTGTAGDVVGDIVYSQAEYEYDRAGSNTLTTSYERTTTGATTGALTASTARRTYLARWYDDLLRLTASVSYGTYGGTTLTRPSQAPSVNSSNDYAVTTFHFNSAGEMDYTTDNLGRQTRMFRDALGRTTKVIRNYDSTDSGAVADTDVDKDQTVEYLFDVKGRLARLRAINAKRAGQENQDTLYMYGDTVNASLVTAEIYPDTTDGVSDPEANGGIITFTTDNGDHVGFEYDRLGRKTRMTAQKLASGYTAATVHDYVYDNAGRLQDDKATTLGTNIDNHVQLIRRTYDRADRLTTVGSYGGTDATDIRNEVVHRYDGWGHIATTWSNNSGAADTEAPGESPKVQYTYVDGASNNLAQYVRLASVTYPSGNTVNYTYGSTGLNRVTAIGDTLASYTYRGVGAVTGVTYNSFTSGQNTVAMTLGVDRLGRVEEIKWADVYTQTPVTLDRYTYGYDNNSNRIYRKNEQATNKDESYTYDGLDRLARVNRGTLTGEPLAIADGAATFSQQWQNSADAVLDSLGNWRKFRWDSDGQNNSWTSQNRTHNPVNELTDVSGTNANWLEPSYDPAGNMVSGPKPGDEGNPDAQPDPLPGTRLDLVYDAWNRLVTAKAGSGTGASTTMATYRYNGLNHRVRKLSGSNPVSPTSARDHYYNTLWQLLETYSDASAIHPLDRYVWGAQYIDAPVIRYRDGNLNGSLADSADSSLYYLYDANFNVTGLMRNTDAQVVERYMYDPYGRLTVLNGQADADGAVADWSDDTSPDVTSQTSDWGNELLYCGYRRDVETGLHYVRTRHLCPSQGRWTRRDPIKYKAAVNLYDYAKDAPAHYQDPSGLIVPMWEDHLPRKGGRSSCKNPVPRQGYTPQPNGCGPEGWHDWVPDSWAGVDFTSACNNHDTCYGTCNSDKGTCDSLLVSDMATACQTQLQEYPDLIPYCENVASIYFVAVTVGGGGAYNAAQDQACDCGCEDSYDGEKPHQWGGYR